MKTYAIATICFALTFAGIIGGPNDAAYFDADQQVEVPK
jgi:hypothetical protein